MCLKELGDFFDKASVAAATGAFLGALFTYIVVRLTGRAERIRKATDEIPAIISASREMARQQLDKLRSSADSPAGMVALFPSPAFDALALGELSKDVFSYLSLRQRLAVIKLAFHMTQANALAEFEHQQVSNSRRGAVIDADVVRAYQKDREDYLGFIIKLADAYIAGRLNDAGFVEDARELA